MKNTEQEKSLIKVNEKSIFYKIKKFFKALFNKQEDSVDTTFLIKEKIDIEKKNQNMKDSFMDYVKNIENDETRLLKLQKQYRCGEVKEEDLSEEQINSLCDLYDKQIDNLRKSNEKRKQKILEYRKKL